MDSLAGPAVDQAPVFVVWGVFVVVRDKFACDCTFLLHAVNTKEGCPFFVPAGCSLELFQKIGFRSFGCFTFSLPL